MTSPSIAIVGMGPRGISVIERLAAHLRLLNQPPSLSLHLIDDSQLGAGRIWDTNQTRTLCMNTLAGAVTLFTEPTSTLSAPALEGPIQYEWIQLLRGDRADISPAKQALFNAHPTKLDDSFSAEIAATRPESNPSRALYGAYLRWAYEVALAQLPQSVCVITHNSRALAVHDRGDHDIIELSEGTQITADATVLAYGWQVPGLTDAEKQIEAACPNLHWVRPDNPIEQSLSDVPAGESVLVRGMGMGFFDIMALLTINRGGIFHTDPTTRPGLRYQPSGKEPHFIVASGRGYPFIPKSEYNALPPQANLTRFRHQLSRLTKQDSDQDLDFGRDLLPHILRDAYAEYYTTQARVSPQCLLVPISAIITRIDKANLNADSIAGLAAELNLALTDVSTAPLDLAYWTNPLASYTAGTIKELTTFIAEGLARDIVESVAAANSPLKAALWAVSAARKEASIAGSQGRLTWQSRTTSYKEFMAFGQMVGSGPPLIRTRQLLALVDAGLVSFLGPRPALTVSDTEFTLTSGKRCASSEWLIDAWMHSPDVRRPADPLAVSLIDRVRAFTDHGNTTGSPETTWQRHVVRPDGSVDPRLHIIGIPTYAQWPDTTISPMPGTDPLMLQETDRTAGSLLAAVLGSANTMPPR